MQHCCIRSSCWRRWVRGIHSQEIHRGISEHVVYLSDWRSGDFRSWFCSWRGRGSNRCPRASSRASRSFWRYWRVWCKYRRSYCDNSRWRRCPTRVLWRSNDSGSSRKTRSQICSHNRNGRYGWRRSFCSRWWRDNQYRNRRRCRGGRYGQCRWWWRGWNIRYCGHSRRRRWRSRTHHP